MKKIFRILVISILCIIFVGCNSNQNDNVKEEPSTIDKEIIDVNITYTETTLENGTIEETVENIYDSVVAINSFYNGTLGGRGSGVLIGQSLDFSFIVTCHHVIENYNSFQITLSNSKSLEAYLVGGDAKSDIAVLAVKEKNLTYASWFSDSDSLKLGSSVICIGNPLGTLPGSVSTGVVSYNNREISIDNYNSMKLIQTDVAINSGNSGGGLFNAAGALIGIVNAKYASQGIEGLGFAIPSNYAKNIVNSLLSTAKYNKETNVWITGYVIGRWNLGFSLGYGGYGFVRTTIGIASEAINETSSDYGKLKQNDLITKITIDYKNGELLDKSLNDISAQTMTIDDVYNFIYSSNLSIGDTLLFTITRNNNEQIIEVELTQFRYYL